MDPLADWNALGSALRDQSTAAIVEALVQTKLRAHPHYADCPAVPRATVYAAARAGDQVVLHFIADFYLYCQTISGSDWALRLMVLA